MNIINLKFCNTLSGTTQYSLNINAALCIDVIKLISDERQSNNDNDVKRLCLGVVGDVVVYAAKTTDNDIQLCAITNARHKLSTLHVYDTAMRFEQHEPCIVTKGLHRLGVENVVN